MQQTAQAVMANVARELASLATLTSGLQEQLSPGTSDGFDIEAFQGLDALTQTLGCLATFLERIGSGMDGHCKVAVDAAIAEIRLSALAERLQGSASDEADPDRCELF